MKTKEKNSSIELLRIICMSLIVMHHYVVHTKGLVVTRFNFTTEVFYLKAISMFGKASCSVFALITGYYMINSNIDWKKIKKKAISLIVLCTFYSVIIYCFFIVLGNVKLSFTGVRNALYPLLYNENWFIAYYILLLLIVPFLNIVLKKIDEKTYRRIIFTMILIWSILPSIFNAKLPFSNIDFFVVMYVIGAYERLYPKKDENKWKDLLVVIVMIFIIIGSILFNYILGIMLDNDSTIATVGKFMEYNNIFCVIWAIYLFKFFKNISFSNKIINCIAGTVLGIYVIHDNSHIRKWIWNEVYPNRNYVGNPYLHSVVKIVAVFSICMGIELVRKYIICRPVKLLVESYKIRRNKFKE